MAGLLDMLQQASQDPATSQGILRFGLSLLQSKGGLGNAIGQAGIQGLQGAQDYRQQDFQRKVQQDQLDQMKRQKQLQALPSQFATPAMKLPTQDNADVGQPGEPPVTPAGFDYSGYTNALMGVDPMQALQFQALTKKQEPTLHMGKPGEVGGTFTNGQWKQLFAVPDKADKPPSAVQEYEYAKKQGFPGTLNDFMLQQKKAGAPSTSVKVENMMGTGLAKEVGPMVKESYDSARGAQQSVTNADTLIKAVDSNKLYAGPGATLRLKGAQVAQVLGIGGKDSAEKIANTRAAIQGLAQATVAARGQLKGQGQVSDYEGRLLQKAASGEVDDLTPEEIRQIAQTNKRLSQQVLSNHGQFIKKLQGDKTTAPIAGMFELPEQAPSTPGVIHYDAQGNRIGQ